MKSHELMLISVYPEMLEDIQAVCQTMHIEPTILQWEIAQQGLLDKLNQMFLELPKPDVISALQLPLFIQHYQPRGHRRHD